MGERVDMPQRFIHALGFNARSNPTRVTEKFRSISLSRRGVFSRLARIEISLALFLCMPRIDRAPNFSIDVWETRVIWIRACIVHGKWPTMQMHSSVRKEMKSWGDRERERETSSCPRSEKNLDDSDGLFHRYVPRDKWSSRSRSCSQLETQLNREAVSDFQPGFRTGWSH